MTSVETLAPPLPTVASGPWMHDLVRELFPLCRSMTGDGVRATLARLQDEIPLEIHEVPSGTRVLDWTVPPEWNVRDAWIADASGRRVVDFADSNLHVMGYSVPTRQRMTLDALRAHLYTDPEHPDWIPYRTSYFRRDWGFCLSQRQLDGLHPGEYEVVIDSTLQSGHLTYGELLIPGTTAEEVLISCHCCHPSLANDNLSGVVVGTALARALAAQGRRLSIRFLFLPATIGPITWLALNRDRVERIHHGLVLACVGDPGPLTYKRSRRGGEAVDRAAAHVLRHASPRGRVEDFVPSGYDERQYCSPGFDLPVGRLTRTPNGRYPQYHTSADDLDLVTPDALADSLDTCLQIVDMLEHDQAFVNVAPYGEPQLGRRGLYHGLRGRNELPPDELALLWVLNQSDGWRTLLDITIRADLPFPAVKTAARFLVHAGLLAPPR